MVLGALIGGATSILGGILGSSSKKKESQLEYERQKEFAQHGIRWKVEDAKQAGIHPLYAVGAPTTTYAAQAATGTDYGLAQAGQDIGRAIDAKRTHSERDKATLDTANALQLQNMELRNELLSTQIAKIRGAGQPPPIPGSGNFLIDGQGDSHNLLPPHPVGAVEELPLDRIVAQPTDLTSEPGAVTERGWLKTPTGYAPVMSRDAKERLEEDLIGMLTWNIRNRLNPSLGVRGREPPIPVPKGYDRWQYDPVKQEYRPVKWNGWRYVY